MSFDGITLKSIVTEMQSLIGAKVNKVIQPNSNEILLNIYNGNNFLIDINTSANNYRINISKHKKTSPLTIINFCMILRKYLISSKIKSIYCKGLERIIYIDFICFNEMNDEVVRTLVIELMGKYSNIVLLNEKGYIIDGLKKFDNTETQRTIMPLRKYIAPSNDKKDFTQTPMDEFVKIINTSPYKTLDDAISNTYTGISKIFIQSCIENLSLSNTITDKSLKSIYNYTNSILNGNFKCVDYKNNYTIIEASSTSHETYQVNNYLDDYYESKYLNEQFINYKNNLLKILSGTLDKLVSKLKNINQKIESCKDMEKYKLYGELIIGNLYRFKEFEDLDELEIENYYDNNKTVKIPINKSKSIKLNAENYFKKYNKLKNTLSVTTIQKKQTSKELSYLESLVYELDNCKNIIEVDNVYTEISENILFNNIKIKASKIKNKDKKDLSQLDNYIKIKIDNFDVLIGKNNKQNDYITTKVANDNDYWFHTKDTHGSHLILRCNGDTPKLSTLTKCAKLAAYHSKAKFSSHVPVDYTLIKNVKKPRGSEPGFVIYTTNKTLYVDPSSEI